MLLGKAEQKRMLQICRRIFGSLLAGLVAGILGVTGWIGFSYYFAAHIVVST